MAYQNVATPRIYLNIPEYLASTGVEIDSIFRNKETNERIYLDELDPKAGNFKTEQSITCDLSCGLAMEGLND